MLLLLEHLAVIASALYGVLLARSKRVDVIGACIIVFVVAFGGGTLRDILLDRRPLFWVENEHYTWIVLAIGVIGSLAPRLPRRLQHWLNVPDALGLGLFSIVGAGFALQSGTSMFIASIFGVIAGTCGGVLGDILVNDVPRLLMPTTPIYATCAFAGCWVAMLAPNIGITGGFAMTLGVGSVVALRLAGLKWNIRVPVARE